MMKQYDIFGGYSSSKTTSTKVAKYSKQGRPKTITPEIVFETKKLLSSKNKISNDEIMQKLNLTKSTFYNFSLTQEES